MLRPVHDNWELPDGFRFGVATSGFQVEGGYNGPGEPANNWVGWERDGRVEPSGLALDFWNRYEQQIERAAATGADSLRLSIEWARCEPAEGELDETALAHYATILSCCHEHGLEPLVTLHHFTHPAWLGEDFWLDRGSPERFASWVGSSVARLSSLCSKWVTINEINVIAEQGYLTGGYPPGRFGDVGAAVRCLDHLLTAHVLAYEVIHQHQPGATVTTNNSSSSVYELDRLLVDVLTARSRGVDRHDLGDWLLHRRSAYYERIAKGRGPGAAETAIRRLVAAVIPRERALPRALAAAYESRYPRCLDVVGIDFYDPVASHHLRLPGHRSAGGRNWEPSRRLWDDVPDPSALVSYCAANADGPVSTNGPGRGGAADPAAGLGVWIVENGLCSRVRRGRPYPRSDGWDRVRYLRENLGAVAAAVGAGIPVTGYWHWSLADNYEWGSYEPRYGIYGVDRERGLRWSDLDSLGGDSAGTYRATIASLRDGGPWDLASRQASRRP